MTVTNTRLYSTKQLGINDELGMMLKEVCPNFGVLSLPMPGRIENNHEKPLVRMVKCPNQKSKWAPLEYKM
jgi:hypothetical protein